MTKDTLTLWVTISSVALSGAACRKSIPPAENDVSPPALRELVTAIGEHRIIEPRLTPFSGYSQCAPRKDSGMLLPPGVCSPVPVESLRPLLVRISGEIQKESAGLPRSVILHMQGILLLVQGEGGDPQEAVNVLEEAQTQDPDNPRILSDLAAAYDLRASRESRPWDLVLALSKGEQALRLAPRLIPARFNRALFLQKLSMRHQACQAWAQYLEVDGTSPWAGEARDSWKKLKSTP